MNKSIKFEVQDKAGKNELNVMRKKMNAPQTAEVDL